MCTPDFSTSRQPLVYIEKNFMGVGKMAINDVVSRGSWSHKRRETTRGGRVPQKVEKWDDVVYGWSLGPICTCTFYVVKVLVTRSRLRQDTTHVVMLGRKKVPNLILLSAKMWAKSQYSVLRCHSTYGQQKHNTHVEFFAVSKMLV